MTFIPNPALEAELEHSAEVKRALKEQADRGAVVAKAIAPVLTGAFRDSIHVEEQGDGYAIVADSHDNENEPDAAYIEFGTSDTPAHHTLADALQSLGT